MNRPGVGLVLGSGGWIPDCRSRLSAPDPACYLLSCISLFASHLAPQGGGEVRWELTGPTKPTCHQMGTPIIGTTKVGPAAGLPGPVAPRPKHAFGRSITPTCGWRLPRGSQLRRSGP